jgi:uncharacterized protein with von Willebrand factor type A (vWA) domain
VWTLQQTRKRSTIFAQTNNTSRRTDNIFKQLDERSLTEAEERIIQQRVRCCVCFGLFCCARAQCA